MKINSEPPVFIKRSTMSADKIILIEVGNNIRKWRTLKGFKQEMLAEALGISIVSVSKIETGKTDIPLRRLFAIAAVLEIKIELLFSDPITCFTLK